MPELALFSLATLGLAYCSPPPEPEPPAAQPSVVLITIDTLRADYLSPYGAPVETGAAAALARDGVTFEDAVSPYPLTLPSHLSLLTGLEPYRHGVRNNRGFRLLEPSTTLAENLAEGGYATAAFVSSFVLGPGTGAERGFQRFDADFSSELASTPEPLERRADVAVDAALAWLGAAGEPFFLWLHLYDPHDPYQPPEPYLSRHPADPYAGEVAYADAAVGRLLGELRRRGLYDSSLIVYTSDHGEGLGDHGERTHGLFLYQAMVRVPLIVKRPREPQPGSRIASLARLIDLSPTILSAAGMPVPAVGAGRDLFAVEPSGEAYAETLYPLLSYGWSALAALRRGPVKYIHASRPELYDLAADPGEERNLIDSRPELAASMAARIEEIFARHPWTSAVPQAVTPEEEARLQALGYVAGTSSRDETGDPFSGPDPKDRLDVFLAVNDKDLSLGLGPEAAVARLRELLRRERASERLWTMLGRNLIQLGRYGEALEAFEQAEKLDPSSPDPPLFKAMSLLETGRGAEARATLSALIQRQPQSYRARLTFGALLLAEGAAEEAAAQFRAALTLNPYGLHASQGLAAALERLGRGREAQEELQRISRVAGNGE